MIPYIIVSLKEFKQVILLKLPKEAYLRALIWYFILACIVYGLYLSYDYTFDFISYLVDLHDTVKFIILGLIVSIYFLITLLISLTIQVPAIDKNKPKNQDFINEICVLIACHNSEDVIGNTLQSALKTFKGEQLYVADNNNSPEPLNDKTKKICENYGANYLYFPIGNKGNALKKALTIIDEKYKYVLTLDDDTLLPEYFNPNKKYFEEDERVSSIGFGIKMKDLNTMSEKLADFEYKLNSLKDYAKNSYTTFFIVGIAGLWKRPIFTKIINNNPTSSKTTFFNKYLGYESPNGEDSYNGVISRLMGYKQKMDFDNFVESYAPPRFFYSFQEIFGKVENISGFNSLNHYSQRALRWYRKGLNRLPHEFFLFFTYNASSINNNFFMKIVNNISYRLSIIWKIIMLYFACGIAFNYYNLLANGDHIKWLIIHIGIYIFGIMSNFTTNFIIFRNRNDLKVEFKVLLIYPFFTTFISFCRMIGVIGDLTYFIPFKTPFTFKFCNKEILCNRYIKEEQIVDLIVEKDFEEEVEICIIDDNDNRQILMDELQNEILNINPEEREEILQELENRIISMRQQL